MAGFVGKRCMKSEAFELIDVAQLRVGMFVDLGVGWMAHPFPTGSFRITSERQIAIIAGLGLGQVRHYMGKSDPDSLIPVDTQSPQDAADVEAALAARQRELDAREQRARLLRAQQRSLAVCERRFGEAMHQYRNTLKQVQAYPKMAANQCQVMVRGFVHEMLADGESAIRLLSEAAGEKSSMHSVNVTVLSLLLGRAMGMHQNDLVDLGMAAFLHDIGKVHLPEHARRLGDTPTAADYKRYQEHVAQGVQVGETMDLSRGVLLAMAQHHELVDGTGFPCQIEGAGMTAGARILALVNRYDNLCNPSRPSVAMTPHEALALIFAQLKSHYDATTLSAFIRMMGVYPPGSVVQLLDDRYALVVSVNSARPLKPRIIVHEPTIPSCDALILDMESAPHVSIRRSVKPTSLPNAALEYLAPRQRVSYFFERSVDSHMRDTHA